MFGEGLDSERVFAHHRLMHRTYVRRRVMAIGLAVAVAAGVGGQVAAAVTASRATTMVSSTTYVVRRGDTLWSIASSTAPERDPREVVLDLQRHNRAASTLAPGQVLAIPPLG